MSLFAQGKNSLGTVHNRLRPMETFGLERMTGGTALSAQQVAEMEGRRFSSVEVLGPKGSGVGAHRVAPLIDLLLLICFWRDICAC